MKTQSKCQKCGRCIRSVGECSKVYQCLSVEVEMGVGFIQSPHCETYAKVAKLKKQVVKLKERASAAEWAVSELQKTVSTLRNPNF